MHNPYWLIIVALLIAVIPLVLGVFTSYLKVSIVLNMLKTGLGAQQVPSNLLVMILSLAITVFVMTPVFTKSVNIASQYNPAEVAKRTPSFEELKKYSSVFTPWLEFMSRHAGEKELLVISEIDRRQDPEIQGPHLPKSAEDRFSARVVLTAYVLSEIKAGFSMGFLLLLPFLVIDLVVANILAGMGMYMLSPVIISLPLKVIFFVSCDGWLLLTKTLIDTYT